MNLKWMRAKRGFFCHLANNYDSEKTRRNKKTFNQKQQPSYIASFYFQWYASLAPFLYVSLVQLKLLNARVHATKHSRVLQTTHTFQHLNILYTSHSIIRIHNIHIHLCLYFSGHLIYLAFKSCDSKLQQPKQKVMETFSPSL